MRSWLVPTVACAALALALCFVPLFDLLGYEFSFALALLAGPMGLVGGLAVGRRRPDGAFTLAPALVGATLMLGPALGIITLNALRIKNCDYWDGLEMFALLPVASAWYGAAWGTTLAQLGRTWRRQTRALCAVAAVVAPLVWSVVTLYREPPIVAFDHLWGYFAGSLYDEVVQADDRLLMFRAVTLARIALLGLLLWTFGRRRQHGASAVALAIIVGVGLSAILEKKLGPAYGFRVTRADIEGVLSVRVTRPGLVIHLPHGTSDATQRAVADDHAFRLSELVRKLDVQLDRPIHSYVYANADAKARLMGGRHTMVAKPWLYEIHVHDVTAPHDVVPHELAHAVAASFGSPFLNVSARYGALVNMGLVEGFAEAFTPPRGELGLDAWSKALRILKLAPDMRQILGPAGFWTEAPRRAYTIAGSFVSYLLRTYGAEPLKRAYPAGDFALAYGKNLDALVGEWEAYLETLPLAPHELHLAEEQFKTPSIFARPCAHEIAELRQEAQRSSPKHAVQIYEKICEHLDHNLASRFELALAQKRAGNHEAFLQQAQALQGDPNLTAAQRLQLLETRAELLWERGDLTGAAEALQAILAAQPTTASQRLQWVRLWALKQPAEQREALHAFLSNRVSPVAAVLQLSAASHANPADKTWPYLLARQLVLAKSCREALPWLTLAAPHPFPPIEAERVRLVAECQIQRGDLAEAERTQEAYVALAPTSGERERAQDTLTRLRWRRAATPSAHRDTATP